jgi:hypothetical protein
MLRLRSITNICHLTTIADWKESSMECWNISFLIKRRNDVREMKSSMNFWSLRMSLIIFAVNLLYDNIPNAYPRLLMWFLQTCRRQVVDVCVLVELAHGLRGMRRFFLKKELQRLYRKEGKIMRRMEVMLCFSSNKMFISFGIMQ